MGNWKKLLSRMCNDQDPRGYTYHDAARVLIACGFSLPERKPKGSHRVWRRPDPGGNVHATLIVVLVEEGKGTLKPVYIRDMLARLRAGGLLQAIEAHDDGDVDN